MSFSVANVLLFVFLITAAVWAVVRDARQSTIPKHVYLANLALYLIGTPLMLSLGKIPFGIWLMVMGLIGWEIGRRYKDDIWRQRFPAFILFGLAVIGYSLI